jgi:RHS repeat-associated protein
MPLAVVDDVSGTPATYYVHADHLNRPVRMTDATKTSAWDGVWLPWGAPQSITGTVSLDARFPGQWYQLEAGLHYNWHRHYDPTLGRYTQPDPLGFVDGPSVYEYVRGNPLGYVDPDGRNRKLPPGWTVIPGGQPPPPIAGPESPWGRWVIPKVDACLKAIKKWFQPEDPCAKEARELEEIKQAWKKNHIIGVNVIDFEKKRQLPYINELIALHNQKCPNHKVGFLRTM